MSGQVQDQGQQAVTAAVLQVLSDQALSSFEGVVADLDQHVLPIMAWIAKGLVVIGERRKANIYTDEIARAEVDGLVDAAASALVRFANKVLSEVQALLNAALQAVRAAVNGAIGIALL